MTVTGFVGVLSALAFVLGLLFLALRLVKQLPAWTRTATEGPELKVLGRAGLTPKQGVATVQVGDRTLVVGYGEGGVRYLADAESAVVETAAEAATEVVEETDSVTDTTLAPAASVDASEAFEQAHERRPGGLSAWGANSAPRKGLPFKQALAMAVKRASIFVWILAIFAAGSAPAWASPVPAATLAAPVATAAALPFQEAVSTPQVDGPQTPVQPTVPRPDFPTVDVALGNGEDDLRLSGPVGTVLFIGFLTLLPTLLLLMTSFTRILVVLHLMKQAIGTQTAPPAHLLSAMALLLTGFVMAPTLNAANETAVRPWMDGQIDEMQMLDSASVHFREFMLANVRDEDLETFMDMRQETAAESVEEIPMVVVTSAFVTSELRSAFQMGFALFLPFVIIDIVVASVLMSMGMFMLPPVMVSLPFKLLLFVMVDGWSLVVGSLVRSFG